MLWNNAKIETPKNEDLCVVITITNEVVTAYHKNGKWMERYQSYSGRWVDNDFDGLEEVLLWIPHPLTNGE